MIGKVIATINTMSNANNHQDNPAALELRENCFNRTDECCKDATFSPEANFLSSCHLHHQRLFALWCAIRELFTTIYATQGNAGKKQSNATIIKKNPQTSLYDHNLLLIFNSDCRASRQEDVGCIQPVLFTSQLVNSATSTFSLPCTWRSDWEIIFACWVGKSYQMHLNVS